MFSRIAQSINKLAQGQVADVARSSTPYFHSVSSTTPSIITPLQIYQSFCTSSAAGSSQDQNEEKTINVTFVETDGTKKQVKVPIGYNMLEAGHENDVEMEGACEGSCACSTCHVIVQDMEYYNKLPDPTDEENDMLDLAFGLTETSRLGCQVVATPDLDGIRLALPVATRNFAVDGYKPKPH